jgi:hypothetical protein
MLIFLLDRYLVEDWRKALKFLSLWAYLLIGMAPTLFDLAVQYDIINATEVPPIFSTLIKLMAFGGAVVRLVNQAAVLKGLKPAPPDDTDLAGV